MLTNATYTDFFTTHDISGFASYTTALMQSWAIICYVFTAFLFIHYLAQQVQIKVALATYIPMTEDEYNQAVEALLPIEEPTLSIDYDSYYFDTEEVIQINPFEDMSYNELRKECKRQGINCGSHPTKHQMLVALVNLL